MALAFCSLPLRAADPIFDVPAILATPLNPRTLRSSTHDGIVTEQVQFHSERDGDTDVEIFAFFSYPAGQRNLPAYIWNPGGLGQSSPAYTEAGARRGYATLCIDFPQPGYRSTGNYPINSGLLLTDDLHQAPIYHGAVALLKAVSYLESRPEVDRKRIGMAGSSWGGFFTTLMVGIDERLQAGSCLYGTGSLQLGNAWWDGNSRNGRDLPTAEYRERWRTTLDPAWRLAHRKTPLAWFTGTNDQFYFLSGVMQTYDLAAGPKHLSFIPNWDHALPQAFHDECIHAWLDQHLQGRTLLPTVSPLRVDLEEGRLVARWTFQGQATSADLIVSYGESGNWRGRYWHTYPATITQNECRAEFPAGQLPCFVSGSVNTDTGLRSSTPLVRIESQALGARPTTAVPDYDGCSLWGDFEDEGLRYLERHHQGGQTRWIPRRSETARHGRYSAIVEAGQTVLPPILHTSTVPHELTAFFRADTPVDIVVECAGQTTTVKVQTDWTPFRQEITPSRSPLGDLIAVFRVPEGATVLVDNVEFRPRLKQR